MSAVEPISPPAPDARVAVHLRVQPDDRPRAFARNQEDAEKALLQLRDALDELADAVPNLKVAETGSNPCSARLVHGMTTLVHRDLEDADEGVRVEITLASPTREGRAIPRRLRIDLDHPAASHFHPLGARPDRDYDVVKADATALVAHLRLVVAAACDPAHRIDADRFDRLEEDLTAVGDAIAHGVPYLDHAAGVEVCAPAPWRPLATTGMRGEEWVDLVPMLPLAIAEPLAALAAGDLLLPAVELVLFRNQAEASLNVTIHQAQAYWRLQSDPIEAMRLSRRGAQLLANAR